MGFNAWWDLTKLIGQLIDVYNWNDYIVCKWYSEEWSKSTGYIHHESSYDSSFFQIDITNFIDYLNFKIDYIKKGKDLDELIFYLHELICLSVLENNPHLLQNQITIQYIDGERLTFLKEINKAYIK